MMEISEDLLFQSVKEIITQSRAKVFRIANSTLLLTYWQIGKLIIENEQQGKERTEYGKLTLKNLSKNLSLEFGKGFGESNLRNRCSFYQALPKCDEVRHELSWTHYRLVIRLDHPYKMNYYINEAVQNNWNYQDLKRQINSLAYERVREHKEFLIKNIRNILQDSYIFEFSGLLPKKQSLGQQIPPRPFLRRRNKRNHKPGQNPFRTGSKQ